MPENIFTGDDIQVCEVIYKHDDRKVFKIYVTASNNKYHSDIKIQPVFSNIVIVDYN